MYDYSIRRAVGSRALDRSRTSLRSHAYRPFRRQGGSLLEVTRALYAEHVPWEVVNSNSFEMAVHAALLPTGEQGQILFFGGDYHAHFSYLHDLATGEIEATEGPEVMPPTVTTDMFCSGHSMLHDGSVLVAGGQRPSPGGGQDEHQHGGMSGGGERACYIYGPGSIGWRLVADLNLDPAESDDSGGRWYPTLLTLANGQVLAVGGHPDVREAWPNEESRRHSNNIPERYHPVNDTWTLLDAGTTADNPIPAYDYQRVHLLPDGQVFFSSAVRGANRLYDATTGEFDDSNVVALPPGMYGNATSMAVFTSVLLPLHHQEGYVARVLLAGDHNSQVCEFLPGETPSWSQTSARDWSGTAPRRNYSIATLLPDGKVFLSGGSEVGGSEDSQAACVLEGEIFDPNFDLANVDSDDPVFNPSSAVWTTVEPANVRRRYHSTALLLPDGTVWHGGSNGTLDFDLPDDEQEAELRIEVYRPPYLQAVDRPQVLSAPDTVAPGQQFNVDFEAVHDIAQVVFIRNGSVTHGLNADQRYITAAFTRTSSHRLRVTAPPNHSVAPPGYYMLWLIDEEGSPCEQAPFVQILAT